MKWSALVPELVVSDLQKSKAFYLQLGFAVAFEREENGFCYLELGDAQLMLEQKSASSWLTADLLPPYGRGVNLQIEVVSITPILDTARLRSLALFAEPSENWYRVNDVEEGQRELLIQDPDGYLLRFIEPLGSREKQYLS